MEPTRLLVLSERILSERAGFYTLSVEAGTFGGSSLEGLLRVAGVDDADVPEFARLLDQMLGSRT
jgi:hypothetical protein